jgi:hypothetical protein
MTATQALHLGVAAIAITAFFAGATGKLAAQHPL